MRTIFKLVAVTILFTSCGSDSADWKRTYEPMFLSAPIGDLSVKRPAGTGWKMEKEEDRVIYKKKLLPSEVEARIGVVLYHSRGEKPTHRGLRRFVNPAYEVVGEEKFKGRKLIETSLSRETDRGLGLSEGILIFLDNDEPWIMDIFYSEIGGTEPISEATRAEGLKFRSSILEGLSE